MGARERFVTVGFFLAFVSAINSPLPLYLGLVVFSSSTWVLGERRGCGRILGKWNRPSKSVVPEPRPLSPAWVLAPIKDKTTNGWSFWPYSDVRKAS